MKKKILDEVDFRLNKLTEEIRGLELAKAKSQGKFDALFSLQIALRSHVKFKEVEKL